MKRKVLFVMDGMKIGGVENALIPVLNRLDFEQFDVDLMILHENTELLDKVNQNVRIYHYENQIGEQKSIGFYFWYALFSISRLLPFAKLKHHFSQQLQHSVMRSRCHSLLPQRYDCVIAYKQGEAENCVAFSIPAKEKIAFYHHGSIIDDELHRKTYSHFQKIVAVSNGVEQMLREQYPQFAEKMMTIQNYVDCDAIIEKAKAYVPDVDKSKKIICSVGRLCEEKRFDRAIDTAAILKQKGIAFQWFIIGEGDSRASLEQQIRELALDNYVILTGSMKNPIPYVNACDVYVQTSDAESYGLAIQEALVLGKPVVSTKTIGGELLIQNKRNGYLSEDCAEDIAAGMAWCLKEHPYQLGTARTFDEIDFNTRNKWKSLLSEV